MTLKSKDLIQITDIGANIKDSLPLLEYRIAENLTEPMRVNQIYKKVIEKYPNDYLKGSMLFFKNINMLESKRIIEKVIILDKAEEDLFPYFQDEMSGVDMSTIVDDSVDIIHSGDLERRNGRRNERWFNLNKNNFDENSDGFEIKRAKEKKLNYLNFSKNKSSVENEDEIFIPIDNPFASREIDDLKSEESDTVLKKIHSNENDEGMVISFIQEEKIVKKDKVSANKVRQDRERYRKAIQKEKLGNQKHKKLKEKNIGIIFVAKKIITKIKKMLTK